MPLPQTPPGGGGRRPHLHWVYIPTPRGKKWQAWIAGPCHWFLCHTKGRSKPCLHAMTGGELTCDVCSPFNVPECIGYQPLYRESDGRPCQVVVHEYTREQIDALKLHQAVWVSRGEGATDAVSIGPMLSGGTRYTSRLPERLRPADLTETLLRMWGIPDLVEWYRHTHGASDTPMSLTPAPPVAPAVTPPPVVERLGKGPLDRLREADERARVEEEEERKKIGSTMDVLLRGVPAKNGFKKKS